MGDHGKEDIALSVKLMAESFEKFKCAEEARSRGNHNAYELLTALGFALRAVAFDLVAGED